MRSLKLILCCLPLFLAACKDEQGNLRMTLASDQMVFETITGDKTPVNVKGYFFMDMKKGQTCVKGEDVDKANLEDFWIQQYTDETGKPGRFKVEIVDKGNTYFMVWAKVKFHLPLTWWKGNDMKGEITCILPAMKQVQVERPSDLQLLDGKSIPTTPDGQAIFNKCYLETSRGSSMANTMVMSLDGFLVPDQLGTGSFTKKICRD
ncbi:MAG: hypothetical protein H6624_15360 [Bdellovibrionaceae bacterium]|nr:hypothetical protein [Bdellovibrionales bacterium]MCB9085724.1 hypothetical protein [Pseudobdellovibrionaceae bacterium]